MTPVIVSQDELDRVNRENADLRKLLAEREAAINEEPKNKTLLPAFAQKLWESMLILSDYRDKAAIKTLFNYVQQVEGKLKDCERTTRLKTLKEAAGMECAGCKDGIPLFITGSLVEHVDGSGCFAPNIAAAILKESEENRGKEK